MVTLCLFQGLNYIAGLMLLIVRKQEVAFWLLDVIVGKILPGIFLINHSTCIMGIKDIRISGKKRLLLHVMAH